MVTELTLNFQSILRSSIFKEQRLTNSEKKKSATCLVVSDSFQPPGLLPTRFLCPWNSPGRNIGVGSLSCLQGIFLTQGWSLGLLHCRQILYHQSIREVPWKTEVIVKSWKKEKELRCIGSIASSYPDLSVRDDCVFHLASSLFSARMVVVSIFSTE